ncbi:glycosyltransferase [Mucilaginibacter pedocola]|uniref:Teichuronic acid biosynthesis glycosyltransferase tuaH n=1 Tax=Mucilaginibacter pedocola TaxID=1792845 RepID=A0A1S9P6Y8_9SPHI|nr:glycosyltransferase [Mucilaginibacter pedocola]OOQ56709.1 hypothetical protein BC343_17080 [Mucilaginibacter pedocola]
MQKQNHIVCCALPAWQGEYLRSTVELMKCLAATNLVLYVDYAYSISDCFKAVLGKKKFDWKRVLGFKSRLQTIERNGENGLYLLSLPPVLPAFATSSYKIFKAINKLNAAITGYFINKAIAKLKMANVVEFNAYQPFLGNYWKLKNVGFKVFYMYDEFTGVPYFKGFAGREEAEYLSHAGLGVVTSAELKTRKQVADTPVEVVNNGVHFDAFYNQTTKLFAGQGGNKIVGYTGNIDGRLDVALLEQVIKTMPTTAFAFIGKVSDESVKTRLAKFNNVFFAPPVAPEEVPYLLDKFDAGIIPYVCDHLTAAIYPLKANEYLAMGLPVVMTPFASLGEIDEAILFADNALKFKRCLEQALAETDVQEKLHRIALAKQADWHSRAEQLQDLIEKYRAAKAA